MLQLLEYVAKVHASNPFFGLEDRTKDNVTMNEKVSSMNKQVSQSC